MKLIKFIIIIFASQLALATEQNPDYLYYNNKELILFTGWGHPSPLQTYYEQNNVKYPFKWSSTANYRGHVAIWEIKDNKLFVNKIFSYGPSQKPRDFGVKSNNPVYSSDQHVFADWFSGVIACNESDKSNDSNIMKSYYFHIKHGNVVDIQTVDDKDIDKIKSLSDKIGYYPELMAKYRIQKLNEKYVSYYFRLYSDDYVIYNGKKGLFKRRSGISPILQYFENDHAKWPFNWENFEKSGAPSCEWVIDNGKIYLTKINLLSGLNFYSIDSVSLSLDEVFKRKILNNRVFAGWISGVFLVKYGVEVEDKLIPGYKEFKPSGYTFLRISSGIIEESYQISSNFNFDEIPPKTDPKLIRLINSFKN